MRTSRGPGGAPPKTAVALRLGFILAILFLSAVYTYLAFTDLNYLSSAGRLGPGFFPRIIGSCLAALCVASLFADIRHGPADEVVSPWWASGVVLALLSGIFVALLNVLGGLLSMIVFMGAALWILNRGRPVQNALVAVLLPVCVYVVFEVWLKAAMPRGMIPLPF